MAFDDIRPVNQDILFDAYGEAIGTTTVGVSRALQVDVVQSVPVSGTITADQGLKSTGDNGWPVVLYDANGDTVTVRHGDGYNATQPGLLIHGQDAYGSGIRALQTIEDAGGVNRLAVDARLAPGTSITIGAPIPENIGNLLIGKLTNTGGSGDMIVDGSVTPVVFSYNADSTNDIGMGELRMVVTTQDFTFDGSSFGGKPALTNGILIEFISEGNNILFLTLKRNEDFLFFPSTVGLTLNNTGPKDVLVASIVLGGGPKLKAGTADAVKMTIRDNLTGGGANVFNYFQAQFYGERIE